MLSSGVTSVSYSFDGIGNYIPLQAKLDTPAALTAMTLIAWVNSSYYNTLCVIGSTSNSDKCQWAILEFDRSHFFSVYHEPHGILKCVDLPFRTLHAAILTSADRFASASTADGKVDTIEDTTLSMTDASIGPVVFHMVAVTFGCTVCSSESGTVDGVKVSHAARTASL